jgi:hypothetical protein
MKPQPPEDYRMQGYKPDVSKKYAQRGTLILEIVGFFCAIMSCWLTEFFDPPFNFTQVAIETLIIGALGWVTVYLTWHLINRLKYLEGFMVICASCKRVKVAEDTWVSIEGIIRNNSDLLLSHGVCPGCALELYGEFLGKGAPQA